MKQRINLRAACVNDDDLPKKHLLKRRVKDRFILNADFYKLRQQSLQKQTLNRTIYTLAVLQPSCPPVSTDQRCRLVRDRGAVSLGVRWYTSLGAEVLSRSGQRYCPVRGRGTVPFGAEVLSRSGRRYCLARGGGTVSRAGLGDAPRSGLGGTPRSGLDGTPRSGCRGSSGAGRTTRFGQGVQLASSGACNSLRAGRTTRFERGVQLAPSGASNSLRAGRTTRFGRGE